MGEEKRDFIRRFIANPANKDATLFSLGKFVEMKKKITPLSSPMIEKY